MVSVKETTTSPTSSSANTAPAELTNSTVTDVPTPTEQAREHNAAIESCRHHIARSNGAKCCDNCRCKSCLATISGLETLATCSREWAATGRSFQETAAHIMTCLRQLPRDRQRALHRLFQKLLGLDDLLHAERELVRGGGFKISALVWALQLGPCGLARGFEDGKNWPMILFDAEQAWMRGHAVDGEYDDTVYDVQGFAKLFVEWGAQVEE